MFGFLLDLEYHVVFCTDYRFLVIIVSNAEFAAVSGRPVIEDKFSRMDDLKLCEITTMNICLRRHKLLLVVDTTNIIYAIFQFSISFIKQFNQ